MAHSRPLFGVPQASVAVADSDERFPVRRIYCVGQNYAAHAREMGQDPAREPPFYFMKPADAVVASGARIPYPPRTSDLHHEIELVAALAGPARRVDAEAALDAVYGYAVGVDLTRRDLQKAAKDKGRPWDTAKGFDGAAPISAIAPARRIAHPTRGRIWLAVNGELRQDGDLADMIWNVAEAIAELSTYFRLEAGDLLFTGTPAGVGALRPGDKVSGGIDGVGEIALEIVEPL